MFDLDRAFVNTNIDEKVFMLNKTILNILSNFIPHETVTVDGKDPISFTKQKNYNKKILSRRKTMFIKAIEIVIAVIT